MRIYGHLKAICYLKDHYQELYDIISNLPGLMEYVDNVDNVLAMQYCLEEF